MSVEENLRKLDAAHEAFNAQDWDGFFELYAESAVYHGPGTPEPLKGRAALREAFEVFHTCLSGHPQHAGAQLRPGRLGLHGIHHYGHPYGTPQGTGRRDDSRYE